MSRRNCFLTALCSVLLILTLTNTIRTILVFDRVNPDHPSLKSRSVEGNYSYINDDYPELLPIDLPEVLLTMEESRHYPILGEDAQEEWASTASRGFGYLRLGPERRRFALSMFHSLHCLRLMRHALAGHHDEGARMHMQHCLSYLRQMILCNPDLTLEPADVLDRDFEVERRGATHVCKDWSAVYQEMERNFELTVGS